MNHYISLSMEGRERRFLTSYVKTLCMITQDLSPWYCFIVNQISVLEHLLCANSYMLERKNHTELNPLVPNIPQQALIYKCHGTVVGERPKPSEWKKLSSWHWILLKIAIGKDGKK